MNLAAVLYTAFICFVLMMPPNQMAAKTLGGVMAALVLIYALVVRKKFAGPQWAMDKGR